MEVATINGLIQAPEFCTTDQTAIIVNFQNSTRHHINNISGNMDRNTRNTNIEDTSTIASENNSNKCYDMHSENIEQLQSCTSAMVIEMKIIIK